MILVTHTKCHNFIHDKTYEQIESKWEFKLEDNDLPADKIERFQWVQVDQRVKLHPNSPDWQVLTWFKGTRTNTFTEETKDKDKLKVIQLVNQYLLDNDYPLVSEWRPINP